MAPIPLRLRCSLLGGLLCLANLAVPAPPVAAAAAAEKAEVMQFARLAVERAVREGGDGPAPGAPGWTPAWTPASRLAAVSPVFLTFVLDGRTRACQGSLEPTTLNLALEIETAARRLAAGDRRHPPVLASELERGRLVVSIPGPRKPLPPGGIDPRRFGLVVETDAGGSGVLLPGEARTFSWMLREARRRAGAFDETAWRAWSFRTEVLGEAALPGLEP